MQDIELSPKKKFNLKFEGNVYEIRKPTLGEARQFQTTQASGEGSGLEAVFNYLKSLGLPREVAEMFDGDQLEELIKVLSAKKN
jgi:hypothetical protein